MNFDLTDGIRMVDEVTKVGFRILASDWLIFQFENQTKNGRMSAGQAKTVKKVCKGNNDNCIAIAERIFEKLQTKKIESKLSLLEMLDMLFLRSNSVRTYVLDNFGK